MKKFEYKSIECKSSELPDLTGVEKLNYLGEKGWQLVFVYRSDRMEWWTLMREIET